MMYRLVKTDGTELGMTDEVLYIKIGESGCFTNVRSLDEAIGVAYKSTPYNLFGHNEIPDADTVLVCPVDGGIKVGEVESTMNVLLGVAE